MHETRAPGTAAGVSHRSSGCGLRQHLGYHCGSVIVSVQARSCICIGAWESEHRRFFEEAGVNPHHKEFAMRKVKFVLGALLLAGAAVTGLAFANMPEQPAGGTCGAWEWTGGTSFRRLCIDGSLYWYEYRN